MRGGQQQAAGDLGVSQSEVQRSRQSREPDGSPGTVTGRDGKAYPAKRKPEYVTPDDPRTNTIQYDLLDRVKPAILAMNQPTKDALAIWFRGIHHTAERAP